MPQVNFEETLTSNHARSAPNFVGEVDGYPEHNYSDEQETMEELQKALENQSRTAVIWNPFRDQNNLCSGGTYGDSGIPVLRQFVPHVIFLRRVPLITPKRPDEISVLMGEAAVGSDVARVPQAADTTSKTLLQIHGAVGAVKLASLGANDFKQIAAKLLIYEIVMQGWNSQGILEDLPEYFGVRSPLLHEKFDAVKGNGRDNSFYATAEEMLEKAAQDGVVLKSVYSEIFKFEPKLQKYTESACVLNQKEVAIGKQLIEELRTAALKMHDYAVGAEGILPKTKEHLENVRRGPTYGKQKYDELDRYLMLHFPSFPMDTEIEKSEKNQRRGMQAMMKSNSGGNQSDDYTRAIEERNRLLEDRNRLLEERLDKLEQK